MESTDKRNPSLKKYFKYMVNSRKLTIKFTPTKIKQIILTDLQIDFSKFSELLQDVSVEMFTFYIQSWPGWQAELFQECIDHPEESYIKFKQFLKEKIVSLKEKKNLLLADDSLASDNDIGGLNPPLDAQQYFPSEDSKRKIKFPYTLEITTSPRLFNSLYFLNVNGNTTLTFKEPKNQPKALSTVQALNHPYVSILFKIPGLIKFSRKNIHKIEMFLCRSSDNWHFPAQERIIDIRKYPARNGIYTSSCLKLVFNDILKVIDKQNQKVPNVMRDDIAIILNEFLSDVIEVDLNGSTIQECTEICYIIGGSAYYCDTGNKSGPLNFRTVYQPQVIFSLVFCGIEKNDITPDGIAYFQNLDGDEKSNEKLKHFLNNITQCIQLSCTICNLHYKDTWSLKQHLLETHYNSNAVTCTKCRQEGHLNEIIENRWSHECKVNTTPTINLTVNENDNTPVTID